MPLAPGMRLGPYEIVAKIGEGGMGEVYRGTDTNLKRAVAIKVLPAAVAGDAERLARFQREAEVLASLNHTHIAQIYGLERIPRVGPDFSPAAMTSALVMEFVDGPTLEDRIAKGPIPIDEALPIAKQIAEALESAHEQGIIHRDLKPANIKVRPDGTVKVLDFGLAKAMDSSAVGRGFSPAGHAEAAGSKDPAYNPLSQSPTITSPAMMTGVGMILGTAAYMSPEQAKGRPADKRCDVWAFGAVLYEMLSGVRAFTGEDMVDVLGAVARLDPDWTRLPPATPTSIRLLIQECLAKDRKARLGDISGALFVLRRASAFTKAPTTPPAVTVPRTARLGWVAAAVLLTAFVGLAWKHATEAQSGAPQPLHLSIALPGEGDEVRGLSLSPDGRTMVVAASIENRYQLWLRDLDQVEFRPLAGTTIPRVPFWSPDSRQIGFFADQKLKVVAASGGPPRTLCAAGLGAGGTWNRDGVILFSPTGAGAIYRVDAGGGACSRLTAPAQGTGHVHPEFMDDGQHFFYVVTRAAAEQRGIYIASLDNPEGRRILADESSVLYVPPSAQSGSGTLLFLREDALMAQAFNLERLDVVGDATSLARPVSRSNSAPQIAASISTSGLLVYLSNAFTGRDLRLTWMDRTGRALGDLQATGQLTGHSLSHDLRTVAVSTSERATGTGAIIWLDDVSRSALSRFTAPGQFSTGATWSPDDRRLVYGGVRPGNSHTDLYWRDIGSPEEHLLVTSASEKRPSDWSSNGRYIVYTEIAPATGADIRILEGPFDADRPAMPVSFAATEFLETHGQISPDGRWMAYTSDESGDTEVYLRPFPSGPGKWRVSTAGGVEPHWRGDGRELFYLEGVLSRRQLMAVPMGLSLPEPSMGKPERLFEFRTNTGVPGTNWFSYAPTPDGQRFLIERHVTAAQTAIDVLPNWRQALPQPGQ